ncbi:MAG TPA: cytochrome P450 [Streptosporangiaceae bacterium]|nr:cytochrome P450 [Streptosporangiaceae bacterium]
MTLVTGLDLPSIDLTSAELAGDRYHQLLADLRGQGWLASSPLAFLVLDREAGEFFLRARETAFPGREIAELFGVTQGPLREQIDANILNQQGERHRRLRALVGPAFTPRAADRWRPAMRAFLGRLWQRVAPAGIGPAGQVTKCDFVAALAKPYPSLTIAAVLGAPDRDAPRLHEWSSLVQRQFDIRALASEVPQIERAVVELQAYVEMLLEQRRAEPGDDLITALLEAEDQGDRLSHEECVNLVLNVIAGGIDTTQAQLSHAMRLFAAHPRQWELLREDPGLAQQAVDEVLRAEPITPFTARICTADLVHRGVTFPAGTIVAVCAERANREQDGGEDFDIAARRDGRLLTFGAGPHFCLGANLARAELEEALNFLAPRMPGLAAAGPAALGGVEGIYGIDELPLSWGSPARSRASAQSSA